VSLLGQFLRTTLPHEGALIFQRWKRSLLRLPHAWRSRGGPPAPSIAMSQLHEAQKQLAFGPCEILKSKAEIDKSSRFLKDQGLILNECDAKNWDLAHLLPKLGHGNILDMGCQGSIVLENAQRLGLIGEKVGIDLVALPPRSGITLIQGDLTKTTLPSAHFDYITCLSVIEHGVDVRAFILECARLLKPGGKLFLTFDYWDPKIISELRMFGLPWTLFSRNDVENLIIECRAAGMNCVAPMDWTQQDGVIHPGYWAPGNFAYTFGITEFVKAPAAAGRSTAVSATLKDVLIVNHNEPACGVYQFGQNLYEALRGHSSKYAFTLANCANEADIKNAMERVNPVAVIYNWHPATLPFITKEFTRRMGSPAVPALGFYHEVTAESADQVSDDRFDFWICGDPTLTTTNPFIFKSGRPLPIYKNTKALPAITTIGTFGFGFTNKGFSRLAAMVQEQFDEAIIRMHIPFSAFFDPDGYEARARIDEARALITKPGIRIDASHELLSKDGLLDFLAGNSMNAFLYDDMHRGIASTLDYAMAVDRPIAISESYMFRHVWNASPSILVEEKTLPEILAVGTAPLLPYKNAWAGTSLVREYENILDRVMARKLQKS
jgi:SAM-dependent methyltransferase